MTLGLVGRGLMGLARFLRVHTGRGARAVGRLLVRAVARLRRGTPTRREASALESLGIDRPETGTPIVRASVVASLFVVLAVVAWAGVHLHRADGPADSADDGPRLREPVARLDIPVLGVSSADLVRSFDAPRSGGRRHRAIDIPAPSGTPVLAAASGTVLRTSLGGLAGLSVCLRTERDGVDLVYAHLSDLAAVARAGELVRRGEVLGSVGSTGNASRTAPHLHFQIVRSEPGSRCGSGEALDPYDLLLVGRD